MDWIKVKVKHIEYDLESAPDSVFRAWIRLMSFVAFIERRPTQEQIVARLGKDLYNALETALVTTGITVSQVVSKVLEDVESTKYKRIKGKERHEKFYNARHNAFVTPLATGADKIREDKIREDKIREDKTVLSDQERTTFHNELNAAIDKIAEKKKI